MGSARERLREIVASLSEAEAALPVILPFTCPTRRSHRFLRSSRSTARASPLLSGLFGTGGDVFSP